MNLLDIKKRFRDLSGRYDLADDDAADTLRFIINSACKNLDRLTENQKTWGSYFNTLAADAYQLTIPHCRAIKEVWLATTTARWQLEKMNLQDIIVNYLASAPDSGSSLYYSPVITRKIPENADLSAFSTYMTFLDTITNTNNSYNGIVILPPPDSTVLVEVRGFFYSRELVNDSDENYWSINHPLTLLKAVMRELEVFNQNKSKTNAWDEALANEITNINKDLVEEIVAEVDVMELKDEDNVR